MTSISLSRPFLRKGLARGPHPRSTAPIARKSARADRICILIPPLELTARNIHWELLPRSGRWMRRTIREVMKKALRGLKWVTSMLTADGRLRPSSKID